jgi:hypothetical protein
LCASLGMPQASQLEMSIAGYQHGSPPSLQHLRPASIRSMMIYWDRTARRASRREEDADLLVRFLRPLLALLMLLRECVTLCFGTAMRIGGMSSSRDDSPGRKVYHGAGAATGVGVGVEVQSASEISALAAGVEVEGEGVGVKVRTGEACEALVDGSQRMDQEGRSSRGRLKGRERVGRAKAREAMLRNEGVVQYRCGPWSGWR